MDENGIPKLPQDLSGLEWYPKDGPLPFVYASRPSGHKCAWTARWMAADWLGRARIVHPGEWFRGEASPKILAYELQDIKESMRKFWDTNQLRYLESVRIKDQYTTEEILAMREFVKHSRGAYEEWVATWRKPDRLIRLKIRPGW